MKILLVEDDEATTALLTSALTDDRHTVNIATDGQMGLMLAETYDYDLVLLDVLVPKLDGISLCRQLRSKGQQMPILLLTAKDSQTDKIMGLDAGADDYVVKPFDLEELRARIRALLRRSSQPLSTLLTWEQLCLDPVASQASYQGTPIALTPKELNILELFLRHPHRVFSRSAIIDRLWSMEESPAESAVTTHIKDLRQKLKAGGMAIDLIETVYGLGYRLKAPAPENSSSDLPQANHATDSTPATGSTEPSSPQGKGISAVQRVLEKFRNSFVTQIAVLQQAEAALQAGELSAELREQSRQEAHKLAGSLGIFGYPNGSRLAQTAEALLSDPAIPSHLIQAQLSPLVSALQQELVKPAVPLPDSASVPLSAATEAQQATSSPNHTDLPAPPLVLLVGQNETLMQQLQAASPEFRVKNEPCPEAIAPPIASPYPDLILLDLSLAASPAAGLALLAELVRQHPLVPVLVLSEQDSLSDRVEVSRLGGKAFLPKSMTVEQILQVIHQALPRAVGEAKVLIVDDDPATLAALQYLLQPWGLQVTTLDHPQHFWDVLIATQPDLVVFDLEMPTFSGIDLCRVVRHDPHWGNLPILVVTAHTDADSIRTVFAAGADDFIAKPIVGPEVVTRILSRIERVRRDLPIAASSKEQ